MAAVDEEVTVGTELAGEHPAHGLWFHDGEGGGGLDRHVDAAVLPELVAGIGESSGGVVGLNRGEELVLLGGGELVVGGSGSFLDAQHVGIDSSHVCEFGRVGNWNGMNWGVIYLRNCGSIYREGGG